MKKKIIIIISILSFFVLKNIAFGYDIQCKTGDGKPTRSGNYFTCPVEKEITDPQIKEKTMGLIKGIKIDTTLKVKVTPLDIANMFAENKISFPDQKILISLVWHDNQKLPVVFGMI